MAENIQITAVLQNWAKHSTTGGFKFSGNIYLDRKGRFVDGYFVNTSSVENSGHQGDIITTKNSIYLLGKPAPTQLTREAG